MIKLHNSGGARPGAGRKSLWGEPTRSMRLPVSMANSISLVANAPDTAMVIWWADEQDIERSMPFLRDVPEAYSLICSKWGKSGQLGIWSNHKLLSPVEAPSEKPDCDGILMSIETAKQICYLFGVWQIIPKSWVDIEAVVDGE